MADETELPTGPDNPMPTPEVLPDPTDPHGTAKFFAGMVKKILTEHETEEIKRLDGILTMLKGVVDGVATFTKRIEDHHSRIEKLEASVGTLKDQLDSLEKEIQQLKASNGA